MTPHHLPASRIERSVSPNVSRRDESMRRDRTMRRVETRQDEAMRRDETRRKRNGFDRPYLQTRQIGMTPYSAGEYGTRCQNGTLDAGNS